MTDTPHVKGYRAYLWECLQALEQERIVEDISVDDAWWQQQT
jgi:hypothetical protein